MAPDLNHRNIFSVCDRDRGLEVIIGVTGVTYYVPVLLIVVWSFASMLIPRPLELRAGPVRVCGACEQGFRIASDPEF